MKHSRLRFAGLFAAAIALMVASGLWWNNGLKDRWIPKRFVAVEPGGLYRSGQISATLIENLLAEHEIGVVIDLNEIEPRWHKEQQAEVAAAAKLGIRHVRSPLHGSGTGDLDHFADALAEIHAARGRDLPVLVHCAAGARRTGAVVALYQVLVQGVPPSKAILELGRYGEPLEGSALFEFVNAQMGPLAQRLQQRGILTEVPDPLPRFVLLASPPLPEG